MSTIRITPRRMTRKANPPPIQVTSEGVVRPGNSGSTIGSPPRRYDHDRLPEDRGYGSLALEVARRGLPGRLSVRQPYMFINPLNMCYRNSVLAMLLNIEPFLGWLRLYSQVSPAGKGSVPETIMSYLYKLVKAYWLSDDPSRHFLEIAIDGNIMPALWTDFNTRWQWERPDSQEDVSEFLDHLWTQARAEIVSGQVLLPSLLPVIANT